MQGKLTFETDDDFSILYKGELYTSYDFSIYIECEDDFDKIIFKGPWGTNSGGKFWFVQDKLKEIRADLSEPRDFTGGNTGVIWEPYTTEADDVALRAKKIAQELKLLPRETVLKMFAEVLDGGTQRNWRGWGHHEERLRRDEV